MRAVILAAGRGSRLGSLSELCPKPLLKLAGHSLLTRMLASLSVAGYGPVTLLTGYRADVLTAHAPTCRTVHNPRWEQTSIAESLLVAADAGALDRGAVVTYGDIVTEPAVFTALLAAPDADVCLPVNTAWLKLWQARMSNPLDDAERLLISPQGQLTDIGGIPTSLAEVYAQFMGILRLSPGGAADLTNFYRRALRQDAAAENWDITALLAAWLRAGGHATTVSVPGGWLEIDTPHDLAVYEELHAHEQLDDLCDLNTTAPEGAVHDA